MTSFLFVTQWVYIWNEIMELKNSLSLKKGSRQYCKKTNRSIWNGFFISLLCDPTETLHYLTLWKPTVFQRSTSTGSLSLPSYTGKSRFPNPSQFDSFLKYISKSYNIKSHLMVAFLFCWRHRARTVVGQALQRHF